MIKSTLIILLFFIIISLSRAQNKKVPTSYGLWINTQYEYYKKQGVSEAFLYRISPWFLYIDSSGKCTVHLLFERKLELGYPISQEEYFDEVKYHYKKNYNVWLYTIKGNDSLLVYGNGMMKDAGIIFRKYK